MSDQKSITKEDALSSLKIAFHALIRSGLSIEEIVDQSNTILRDLIDSDDITLLSPSSPGMVRDKHVKKLGEISFDTVRNTILFGNQRAKLSPSESLLMDIFINNPGMLLSHQEIVTHVVGESNSPPAEVCRPIISRLRSDLSVFPEGKSWIETIRGKGYVFVGDKNI